MEKQNQNTCENCGYYLQHFIWNKRFIAINCGHCVHPPRTKRCRPLDKACPKWIPQTEEHCRNYLPPTR